MIAEAGCLLPLFCKYTGHSVLSVWSQGGGKIPWLSERLQRELQKGSPIYLLFKTEQDARDCMMSLSGQGFLLEIETP